jgi:hypothetical protein
MAVLPHFSGAFLRIGTGRSDRDGLFLLLTPTGIRYWRLNHRDGGQRRTLSFRRWHEIRLGQARSSKADARGCGRDSGLASTNTLQKWTSSGL